MSLDAFSFVLGSAPQTDFRDLDAVETLCPSLSDDGDVIPKGSRGTVVSVIRSGLAYGVEFNKPYGAIATLLAGDLRRTGSAAA